MSCCQRVEQWSFVLSKSKTMKMDGECLIELIGSCRNKVQVYRSVRMLQLLTSLHFHLTPIVIINGSSRHDSEFFFGILTIAHSPDTICFITIGVTIVVR